MTTSMEAQFEDHLRRVLAEADPESEAESTVSLFTLIRAANLLVADFDSTVWRDFGVTFPGFRVIFVIAVSGPREPRTIAQLASVSRASISSVINTLERDGYVVRRRESADRRLVTVHLTSKGEELWRDSFAKQSAREREWAAALNLEQRKDLTGLLKTLIRERPRDHVDPAQAPQGTPA